MLKPDVDRYTRCVEIDGEKSLKEILALVDIPDTVVAFAFANGKLRHLDYRPSDGDIITLQPPVSGG